MSHQLLLHSHGCSCFVQPRAVGVTKRMKPNPGWAMCERKDSAEMRFNHARSPLGKEARDRIVISVAVRYQRMAFIVSAFCKVVALEE